MRSKSETHIADGVMAAHHDATDDLHDDEDNDDDPTLFNDRARLLGGATTVAVAPAQAPPAASTTPAPILALMYAVCVIVGMCTTTQAAVNGRLGSTVGSAVFACVFSYAGGVVIAFTGRAIEMCINKEKNVFMIKQRPKLWQLTGGLFGSFYVTSAALLTPIIGFSAFYVLYVFGQLLCSSAADHVGLLGTPVQKFNWVSGIALVTTLGGASLFVMDHIGSIAKGDVAFTVLYYGVALLAGVGIPFQALVNRHLAGVVDSKFTSNLVSFMAGELGVVVASFVLALVDATRFQMFLHHFHNVEWWMFFGGPLGLTFVLCGILFIRIIGVAMFFSLVIAGQLASSLLFDNFGAFGTQEKHATIFRICGVVAVYVGLLLSKLAQRYAAKPAAVVRPMVSPLLYKK